MKLRCLVLALVALPVLGLGVAAAQPTEAQPPVEEEPPPPQVADDEVPALLEGEPDPDAIAQPVVDPVEPKPARQVVQFAPHSAVASVVPNDDGHHLAITWKSDVPPDVFKSTGMSYLVFRSPYANASPMPPIPLDIVQGQWVGDWLFIAPVAETSFTDDVTDPHAASKAPAPEILRSPGAPVPPAAEAKVEPGLDRSRPMANGFSYAVVAVVEGDDGLAGASVPAYTNLAAAETAPFNTDRWFFLLLIVFMALALWYFVKRITKNPHDVFIRRIAGVDAIEDAVGRSTEMGRPVLYVTGTEEIQNIQTIASLLVLGHVAEMTAEYDTEIKVANFFPLTMVVAEEIVKQGFANAGRIDAHKPENVMFISAEQFAYAAGINGMILRDKPATNIYLGRFFAESLILAETGYVTKAVQIAGTAEITQLPFFIAACDYTIIGEELYAVSAYLSREPGLLATLKSTDLLKLGILILLVIGLGVSSFGIFDLGKALIP